MISDNVNEWNSYCRICVWPSNNETGCTLCPSVSSCQLSSTAAAHTYLFTCHQRCIVSVRYHQLHYTQSNFIKEEEEEKERKKKENI